MRIETWIPKQPKEMQPNLWRFVNHNNSLTNGHNGDVWATHEYTGEIGLYHVRIAAFEDECAKRNVLASYPLPNNNLNNRWCANPAGLQWSNGNIPDENDNGNGL